MPLTIYFHQAPSPQCRKSEGVHDKHMGTWEVFCVEWSCLQPLASILIISPFVIRVPEWYFFPLALFLLVFWSCLAWWSLQLVDLMLPMIHFGKCWNTAIVFLCWLPLSIWFYVWCWMGAWHSQCQYFGLPNNLLTCHSIEKGLTVKP